VHIWIDKSKNAHTHTYKVFMHGIIVLVYILGYYTVYTEVALVVSHQVFTRASMHQSVEQDRLMRSGTFLLSFWG